MQRIEARCFQRFKRRKTDYVRNLCEVEVYSYVYERVCCMYACTVCARACVYVVRTCACTDAWYGTLLLAFKSRQVEEERLAFNKVGHLSFGLSFADLDILVAGRPVNLISAVLSGLLINVTQYLQSQPQPQSSPPSPSPSPSPAESNASLRSALVFNYTESSFSTSLRSFYELFPLSFSLHVPPISIQLYSGISLSSPFSFFWGVSPPPVV